MEMKRGDVPTVEQWAQLRAQGWTVDSWNAEMDARRAQRASDRRWLAVAGVIATAFVLFVLRG